MRSTRARYGALAAPVWLVMAAVGACSASPSEHAPPAASHALAVAPPDALGACPARLPGEEEPEESTDPQYEPPADAEPAPLPTLPAPAPKATGGVAL